MMWDEIIKTLGGSAILVAALAWLARSLLTKLLSKDLEKFKSDLQVSSQQSIEGFKSSLQIEAHRRSIEFSALHSKRAEFVAELYAKLQSLYRGFLGLCLELGRREGRVEKYAENILKDPEPWVLKPGIHLLSPEEEEKAKALQKSTREFLAFYSEQKIYFSPEVCGLIDDFATLTGYMAMMYENVALKNEDGHLFVNPVVKDVWDKAGGKIPMLLVALEKEFRLLLGVLK